MTERRHGLVLGKFTAGFVGLVAMAALVTGAVVAANAPSPSVAVADATAAPTGTTTNTATVIAANKLEASQDPSFEASEHASSAPESTASRKPAASCDPSLDAKEDQAEFKAKGQTGDYDDDKSPNPNASPAAARTPETSEPPSCHKADPDTKGDQKSGKTAEPIGRPGDRNGSGHGGLIGIIAPDLHLSPRGR